MLLHLACQFLFLVSVLRFKPLRYTLYTVDVTGVGVFGHEERGSVMSTALSFLLQFLFFSVFEYDRRMRNDGHEVHEKHGLWGLVLGGGPVGFLEFLGSLFFFGVDSFILSCELALDGLDEGGLLVWTGQGYHKTLGA